MKFFILVCLLLPLTVFAQSDSSVMLRNVVISDNRCSEFNGGRIISHTDSIDKTEFDHRSLDKLLETSSGNYLKNYGPGTLSSLSSQGGSSYHTAVNWNGFQLSNPMNGQLDISLLQTSLFDQIEFTKGGLSTLWGSGAISGTLNLTSQTSFNSNLTASAELSLNEFGNARETFTVEKGYSKSAFQFKAFHDNSHNEFSFLKNSSVEKQTHNLCKSNGAMIAFALKTGTNSVFNAGLWLQQSEREIGPLLTQAGSSAEQRDQSERFTIEWKGSQNKFHYEIRSAFFYDYLNYSDSLLDSPSKASNSHWMTEGELRYKVSEMHSFSIGLSNDYNYTDASDYQQKVNLRRPAAFFAYRGISKKLDGNITVRKEFSSLQNPPLTAAAGLTWKVMSNISFTGNFGNVFRLPTVNDLYWMPGGNPDLLPETGTTGEIGLHLLNTQLSDHLFLQSSVAYFDKHINNWISWVPTGSFWEVENIKSVHSNGFDTNGAVNFRNEKFTTGIAYQYSYTVSTTVKTTNEYDESKGKQLIYVPFDKSTMRYYFSFRGWMFTFRLSYTGFRYTTNDNLKALPEYTLGSIGLQKAINYRSFQLNLYLSTENLFNVNYQTIANHPEPLRYFEGGIKLTYRQNN